MTEFDAAGSLSYGKMLRRFSGALVALLCLSLQLVAQSPTPHVPSGKPARATVPLTNSVKPVAPKYLNLGKTVKGRDITATIYGSGEKRVLVFGGIHGDE